MPFGLEMGSLADWVSGIGTMITIIASFHFYHRQEEARFTVNPISGVSSDDSKEPQSMLKIENIGYRPINIVYLGTSTKSKMILKYSNEYRMERSSTIPTEFIVGENKEKVGIFSLMGLQMNEMAILPVWYKTEVLFDKAKKVKKSDNQRATSMIFIDNVGYIYMTKMFINKVNINNKKEYFIEVDKTQKFKRSKLAKYNFIKKFLNHVLEVR